MTSKEALKNRIQTLKINHKINHRDIANKEILDIALFLENYVLKDLERLEQLEKENQELKEAASTYWDAVRECIELRTLTDGLKNICDKTRRQNEKLKKAIEIIKEKAFLKINIKCSENEKSYHFIGGKSLTNEEFELLKEVLE